MNLDTLRKERRELAHRKRRIIYNNDGDDAYGAYGFTEPLFLQRKNATAADFLAQRTTGVEDTHVDTISYCSINGNDFGISNCPSKVCDVIIPGTDEILAAPDGWEHPGLLIEGKDALAHIIGFCRRHGIEAWASARMNDTHAQWQIKHRIPFKANHPERWVGKPPDLGGGLEECLFYVSEGALEHPDRWIPAGSHGLYYAADYGRDDVRDKIFEILQEVCENYPLDGIELDFLRGLLFFRPTAQGCADVGQDNRDTMTDLMRRIRTMTEEIGMKRGRPIVVAMRVPDDTGYAAGLGLETPRWLAEGLVDIMIAGAASRLRPWKESVALAHEHGVPFYACAIEVGGGDEVYRGRALAAWGSGVDGIYTFNEFDPATPLWRQLGDPDVLRGLDRVTPVDNANVTRFMDHLPRFAGIGEVLARPPRLPLALIEGEDVTFEFATGEEGASIATSATPHVTVRLRFDDLEDEDEIVVSLNGHLLDGNDAHRNAPEAGWISYGFDPSFVQPGDSVLSIRLAKRDPRAEGTLALCDVALHATSSPQELTSPGRAPGEPVARDGAIDPRAFLVTKSEIIPPGGRLSARQQALLEELNFARPRVPGRRVCVKHHYNYPADPAEDELPGWASVAILFDADAMGDRCATDMMLTFFREVDPGDLAGELGIYAGYFAGSRRLAGIVARSERPENLAIIAGRLGDDCAADGLLPVSCRFLEARGDGNLIPRAFALMQRGTLCDGVFQQSTDMWEKLRIKQGDLDDTPWRLE